MEDFYATFVGELPRDEWGHPVLPTPEKIMFGAGNLADIASVRGFGPSQPRRGCLPRRGSGVLSPPGECWDAVGHVR